MSYLPFKLRARSWGPATVATLATVPASELQSVATVASVASGKSGRSEDISRSRQTVATVATVARGHVNARDRAFRLPDPDEADLDKRAAIAIDGGVPAVYADAWARLQLQKPLRVSDSEWRQAIVAAGRFLDQWGSLAVDFQWTAGDLFDVPGNGKPGGLIWFMAGQTVRSLGPEHAATDGGRVFDRIERGDWINPFQKRK